VWGCQCNEQLDELVECVPQVGLLLQVCPVDHVIIVTSFHTARKVTGHILIETEMKLYFINALQAIAAVINWVTSVAIQLAMPYYLTTTVMDNACVIVKVLVSLAMSV